MTLWASSYLNVVSGHISQLEFFSTKSSCIIPSQYLQVIIPELQEKYSPAESAPEWELGFVTIFLCVSVYLLCVGMWHVYVHL